LPGTLRDHISEASEETARSAGRDVLRLCLQVRGRGLVCGPLTD
jgi:hypothetical protein